MIVAKEQAVDLREAAKRLNVSVSTIRRMIDMHEIRAFKVLGQWRIKESEIERIMNRSSDDADQDQRDE